MEESSNEENADIQKEDDQEITQGENTTAIRRLSDLGFVYRVVPCQQHSLDHTKENCEINCFQCRTCLFYKTTSVYQKEDQEIVSSNDSNSYVRIDRNNQNQYVPKGVKFNKVSHLCQQIVQERIIQKYHLEKILLSRADENDSSLLHINALVSPLYYQNNIPILIIITGKGDSRAGIISTRELVLSSIEEGSTEYYLEQARQDEMGVILLDPNACGPQSGMTCVEKSLTRLFSEDELKEVTNQRPVYILAHSAAGGYLVRYLLLGECRQQLRNNLHAICFTDSTHNLQWTKNDEWLYNFLQSKNYCLYIRHTKTHHLDTFAKSEDRKLGQEIPYDLWWERRFGTIRTVWAGTPEHCRICWNCRDIIWNFFFTIKSKRKGCIGN